MHGAAREWRQPTWAASAWAVFRKDVRSELRSRVALSAMGVFCLSALFLIALATAPLQSVYLSSADGSAARSAWSPESRFGLMWVLLCFAAFVGLGHSFVSEEDAGTATPLRMACTAEAVYAGKLAVNAAIMAGAALLVIPSYCLVCGLGVGDPIRFTLAAGTGCAGLAASATIVGALAARARGATGLFSALGLPLAVVFLMLLQNCAAAIYADLPLIQAVRAIGGLVSYVVLLVAVSALVFRYVWEDAL
ncbi:MAG: hypothetical protein KGJ62_09440 [Armatimonadetes bacterium]|nr:hypothetical protein [Armatimonadota bacterium]MDE2206572.1 hypothetical protein [Armatimonadota bacterium]